MDRYGVAITGHTRAPLLITQHFPCFSNLFETGFGIGFFADIWMVLAGQSAIGGLNRLEIVRRFHAHNGVIILKFHSIISLNQYIQKGPQKVSPLSVG